MSKKILITGAAGVVGQLLVSALADSDVSLRLGTRSPDKLNGKEAVYLDLSDDDSMRAALKGVEKVFFVTPALLKSKSQDWDELASTKRFIDLACEAGVEHIVRLSAMNVQLYKNSAHFKVEEYLKASGMKWTMLRPAFFMQIFNMYYLPSIKESRVIDYYDGDVKEVFIDARDIAAVAKKALLETGHAGQTYTLTSDELLNYQDVADKLSQVLGEKIEYTAKSDEDTRKALRAKGLGEEAVEAYVGILQAVQAGVFSELTDDVLRVLGRAPLRFSDYAGDYKREFLL